MKRMIPLLLLVCLCAVAASRRQFFAPKPVAAEAPPAGWAWSPTNNSDGTSPLTWWVTDGSVTNGGRLEIPNYQNANTPLTNTAGAASGIMLADELNGYDVWWAEGSDYVRQSEMSGGNVFEMWVVMNNIHKNNTGDGDMMFTDYSALRPSLGNYLESTAQQVLLNLDAVGNNRFPVTNTWYVLTLRYIATEAQMRTNNVDSFSATVGDLTWDGLVVGGRHAIDSLWSNMRVAEILTYNTTLPSTNVTWSSNVFAYLTNKYAL